jgi:hypothetical protein
MSEVAVTEPCYCGVIKDDVTRRPTQCDPVEEPSIDPENMPEPLGVASLAADTIAVSRVRSSRRDHERGDNFRSWA